MVDAQQSGLGREFIQAFNETLKRIDQRPDAHQVVARDFRRALMTRSPYAVYVIITDEVIVVYGVIHQSRAPTFVIKRLK